MLEKIKFSLIKLILILYVVTVFVVVAMSVLYYWQAKTSSRSVIESRQQERIDQLQQRINKTIDHVINDLKVLRVQGELHEYFDNAGEFRDDLSAELLDFVTIKRIYDQARLLDSTGQEKVRINWNSGNPQIVDEDDLQFKGDRYYFRDAYELNDGEIFVSPFDLNIEQGQIEQPLKPMLRVATPIYHQGEKRGVLLLNYLGQELIDLVGDDSYTEEQVFLLNRDGYWMSSADEAIEWGFMYDDKQEQNMVDIDPLLWGRLIVGGEGQFMDDDGLYTFVTLQPFVGAQASSTGSGQAYSPSLQKLDPSSYFWKLVLFVPQEDVYRGLAGLAVLLLVFDVGFVVVVGIGVLLLSWSVINRDRAERKVLKLNELLRIITKILRHDLANNMTGISMALQAWREDPDDSLVADSEKAAQEGIRLIQQMKALEKSYKEGESLQKYEVSKLAKKVLGNYKLEAQVRGRAEVMADEALEVVFDNAISNSVRHGAATKVVFDIQEKKDEVEINIMDNGSGVPEKVREKVFEEGFKYGDTGNSGLGLYIAKQTIERYGGGISVQDNEMGGTTLLIKLPKV